MHSCAHLHDENVHHSTTLNLQQDQARSPPTHSTAALACQSLRLSLHNIAIQGVAGGVSQRALDRA